ncbi:MAG: radical SAM/SPASM domain-containing protein, partial [Desulfobacca sp.]|uniref:radical SAM/SPASM domain-containing protein n=1 Tax=Desulfobacca sp. TaxID=2067990 RepID=UPI00404A5856
HLPLKVFQLLQPTFKKVNLVYLQGWGEPFLHPDLFTMVALARQAGCRVGATTNATLLSDAMLSRVVASGLDILAFSLTGLGANHDAWRPGTSYAQVLDAMRRLAAEKRRQGRDRPRVHVAYLLLRSGLPDLPSLPKALSGLGIDHVVISTLDLVAAPELRQEALKLGSLGEWRELQRQCAALVMAGARQGLSIHPPALPSPKSRPACPENILRAAVISAAGDVFPCVYQNLPATGGQFSGLGSAPLLHPCLMGNIQQQPFLKIWQSDAYHCFRRAWQTGHLPLCCQDCLRIKTS